MLRHVFERKLTKVGMVVLAVMLLLGIPALSGRVEAASSQTRPLSKFTGINPSKCSAIEIHLTGKDQYTVACTPKSAKNMLSPNSYTYQAFCHTGDIELHYNLNYNDGQDNGDIAFPLCISGIGSINDFTKIPVCYIGAGTCSSDWWGLGGTVSWNDQTSSFKTGYWYGDMYWDINERNYYLQINPNETCPYIGNLKNSFTNGPTNWNDRVSSITVAGSYSRTANTC